MRLNPFIYDVIEQNCYVLLYVPNLNPSFFLDATYFL